MRKTRQEERELSACLRSEPRSPASGSAIHLWHSAATEQGVSPRAKPLILHWGCWSVRPSASWGGWRAANSALLPPAGKGALRKMKRDKATLHPLLTCHLFFRGDRVALLAAEDMLSRATTSFWRIRRGSRGGCWSRLKVFCECHRKRNHYESVLKAYSLLRKGLLKNVGCMPKTAS